MTLYEILTLFLSVIAIVISTVSLVRTRILAAEQLNLERVTAELSKLQIKNLEEQEHLKTLPILSVAITKIGGSSYFVVVNKGKGSAYKVNFEIVDCQENPLINNSIEILPYPEMKPDSRFKLLAAFHMNSPLKYHIKLSWQNNSGDNRSELHWVSR